MTERHYHEFAPLGGFGQRGTERMQQFCACGAQRCGATSSKGKSGIENGYRCKMAARAGELTCVRHENRAPEWLEGRNQ